MVVSAESDSSLCLLPQSLTPHCVGCFVSLCQVSDNFSGKKENLPLEALGWYLICFVHKINPQFIFPPYPCISTVLKLNIEPSHTHSFDPLNSGSQGRRLGGFF